MLVSCNIPLHIVNHPNFVKFMEIYTGKVIPSQSSLKEVLTRIFKNLRGRIYFLYWTSTTVHDCSVNWPFILLIFGSSLSHLFGRYYQRSFILY
uniref:Putative LOC100571870 [Acyrthosiphon pisum] n=1 Tax=Lepeophtheirus salmonis TaxID=72036 RepID=A0A0K2TUG7_LEPSM